MFFVFKLMTLSVDVAAFFAASVVYRDEEHLKDSATPRTYRSKYFSLESSGTFVIRSCDYTYDGATYPCDSFRRKLAAGMGSMGILLTSGPCALGKELFEGTYRICTEEVETNCSQQAM